VTTSKGRGSEVASPELPSLTLEVVRERIAHRDGFLHVRRLDLAISREGGARSATFEYDVLDRRALDASVVVAHHVGPDGQPHVWMRSCVRPPIALRTAAPIGSGVLWEVPAGLIEPGESPVSGAARELAEELGFTVAEAALAPLGTWTMPAPAFIGEVHHFFHARVDPMSRGEPVGDGSPLEDAPVIFALPLESALGACRRGEIRDAKTELALRRLQDVLS
jgi:ADP-ribose pyrophosphatase